MPALSIKEGSCCYRCRVEFLVALGIHGQWQTLQAPSMRKCFCKQGCHLLLPASAYNCYQNHSGPCACGCQKLQHISAVLITNLERDARVTRLILICNLRRDGLEPKLIILLPPKVGTSSTPPVHRDGVSWHWQGIYIICGGIEHFVKLLAVGPQKKPALQ